MIKALNIFFLFILFGLGYNEVAVSQEVPDSLQIALEVANDSSRIEMYIQIGKEFVPNNPTEALKYFDRAHELALDTEDQIFIANTITNKGIAYYHLEEIDKSTELYYEALRIYDSADFVYGKIRALNNIGWNFRVLDRQEDAIVYLQQSLELAEQMGDLSLLQGVCNNLGTAYRYLDEKEKALNMFQKSLAINQQIGNRKWEAFNHNNIGLILIEFGEYEKAKESYYQARNINLEIDNKTEYVNNLLNIGNAYRYMSKFDSAHLYLDFAFTMIEGSGMVRKRFTYYDYKADLYEAQKKFKEALQYHRNGVAIEKEMNKLELDERVLKLQAKYDNAQKFRELEESERKINEQRIVIIGGISLLLLLLGVLFLVLQLYKSKNQWAKSVTSLNDDIKHKNEELQTMNEEVQSINDKLELSVKERTKRIKSQNEKLVKYAFINSHEVRGPLARVLGLLYLLGLEKKSLRNDESFTMLGVATKELDDVIGNASKLLEDEDLIVENKEINK